MVKKRAIDPIDYPVMYLEGLWVTESRTYDTVSYTHLRAHETPEHLVCRLLLEKKKIKYTYDINIQ